MDLPFRMQSEPGDEPVLCVDGALGAPGLELSHWPGNRTPAALKHELSTGIALAFARLSAEERARLAAGCVAVANNHLDTDGACAALAVLRPDEALPRAARLLAAAEAGDYFRVPDEDAFVVDAIVSGLADPARSPLRARFAGLSERARHELVHAELMERLPAILDGAVEPYEALWSAPLARLRTDRETIAAGTVDELVHLELAIFRGAPADADYAPGRHALFATTRMDRALVLGPLPDGTTCRLIVNTSSWFDAPGRVALPRPDLAALARRLDALEVEHGGRAGRWHAQPTENAAPELWHGAPFATRFAEHNPALEPSRVPEERLRRETIDALRAVWAFPE